MPKGYRVPCLQNGAKKLYSLNMILALTLAATMTIQKPQVEVGKHVPDVSLVDMAGNSVRLSSFRGKKLILFNWASW